MHIKKINLLEVFDLFICKFAVYCISSSGFYSDGSAMTQPSELRILSLYKNATYSLYEHFVYNP